MKHNMVGWFEIPVLDMNRAQAFYENVFGVKLSIQDFGGFKMAWFPFDDTKPGTTGTLVKHEAYVPSQQGTLVYFNCINLQDELDRIESSGGQIIQQKTQISPEYGYMGLCIDTEGNRIALHSMA